MGKIAYTLRGAAKTAAVTVQTIETAISEGVLCARHVNDQPIVLHTDLKVWGEGLPDYLRTRDLTPEPMRRPDEV